MYYLIFKIICWGRSDSDIIIVKCSNKTDAEIKLRAEYPGAQSFEFLGRTGLDILE